MYIVRDLLKFTEEDVYNDGCQPDSGTDCLVGVSFTDKTVKGLVAKIAEYLDVETSGDNNAVEMRACDEPDRIDFAKMENEDGTTPTERELTLWKAGKVKLWYAVYTCHVEKIEPVEL